MEPNGRRHLDETEDLSVKLLERSEVLGLLTSDTMKQALMTASLWKFFYNEEKNRPTV